MLLGSETGKMRSGSRPEVHGQPLAIDGVGQSSRPYQATVKEPWPMSKKRNKKRPPKRTLALPDLEQSKAAVLNTLTSKSGQRSYDRAITGLHRMT
jgi:hypothetical protein